MTRLNVFDRKKPVWVTLYGRTKSHNVVYWMEEKYIQEWLKWGLTMSPIDYPDPASQFVGTVGVGWKLLPIRQFYIWNARAMGRDGVCHVLGGGSWLTKAQAQTLLDDGVEVFIRLNSIPEWAVDLGLLKPWCFVQDLFAFRNPFSGNPFKKSDLK